MTGGNRIARATLYDVHGNLLKGSDLGAVAVSQTVSLRGSLLSFSLGAQSTQYQINSIGLTTHVTNPFGDTTQYVYDVRHKLIDVLQNGQSLLASAPPMSPTRRLLDRLASMVSGVAVAQSTAAIGVELDPLRPRGSEWLTPGAILVLEANRNLALKTQRLLDRCLKKEPEEEEHRGKIQAQGNDYPNAGVGDSEGWGPRATPLKLSEGLVMLDALVTRMTRQQYANRAMAIPKARTYMTRCSQAGGCGPGKRSFYNDYIQQAGGNERLDIDIFKGKAFTP